MLNILTFRHSRRDDARTPRVAIVASRDRRVVLKRVLDDRVSIVGELISDSRIHLLHDVGADIVFVDAHSPGINPLAAAQSLVRSGSPRQVVILADNTVGRKAFTSAGFPVVHLYDAATVLHDRERIETQSRSESCPAAA